MSNNELMLINDEKKDINDLGILAGMFFAWIPFYFFIRFFGSLGDVKRKVGSWLTGVFALVLQIIGFILFIIPIGQVIEVYRKFMVVVEMYDVPELDVWKYLPEAMMYNVNWGLFGLSIVIFIIAYVLEIITGLKTKKYLDSAESSDLDDETRYKMGKYAGIFLMTIPFYWIIKIFISEKVIKRANKSIWSLSIAYVVIYLISGFILGLIPFIGVILLIALLVIAIIAGLRINEFVEQNENNILNQEQNNIVEQDENNAVD